MCKQLRDIACFSRFDLGVETLDDHLAQALRGAHDIGGIDRLVRGDQDKALAAVDHRRVRGLIGSDRIVLDRLVGAVLHQRNMLMSRSVIYDLRPVLLKDIEDLAAVAHRADQHHKIELRIFLAQLQLNVICVILINIKNDQLCGVMRRDLSAKLTSDRSAAAGYQNPLAVDEVEDLLHIGLDRLSSQKILYGDLLHNADADFAVHQLIKPGQILQLAVGLLTYIKDIPPLLGCRAGHSQIDLLDPVLIDIFQNSVPAADDRNAVNIASPLIGVIVNYAAHPVIDLSGPANVGDQTLSGVTGADHHYAPHLVLAVLMIGEENHEAIGKPSPGHENKLQSDTDQIVRDRHPLENDRDSDRVEGSGDARRHDQVHQFRITRKSPQAPVQLREGEYDQAEYRIDRHKPHPGLHKVRSDLRKLAVKTEPKRHEVGHINYNNIIYRQKHRNYTPMALQQEGVLFLLIALLLSACFLNKLILHYVVAP